MTLDDVDMGPEGWQTVDDGAVDEALASRRPGLAIATASTPGMALHCAICRSAGVRPDAHAVMAAAARMFDMPKQKYWWTVNRGGLQTISALAAGLGYYVVSLPNGRFVVGDMPVQVSP